MYVCMSVCMYACMYVCMKGLRLAWSDLIHSDMRSPALLECVSVTRPPSIGDGSPPGKNSVTHMMDR